MIRRVLGRAVLIAPALLLCLAAVASAAFTAGSSAGATYSAATLSPPSGLTSAAGPCTALSSASIRLYWVATPSSWADGYEVLRSTTSGGPYSSIATVSGVGTTTHLDGSLPFSTTYYYVVRATKGSWRSALTAQVARTTPTLLCV